jgi:hypothetical protein
MRIARIMKKFSWVLASALLVSSCGSPAAEQTLQGVEPDVSVALTADKPVQSTPEPAEDVSAVETTGSDGLSSDGSAQQPSGQSAPSSGPAEPMSIAWGWGLLTGASELEADMSDTAVIRHFNELFGVTLDMRQVTVDPDPNDTDADIFFTNADFAWTMEATRPIPLSMIERHAPRYAQILKNEPYLKDLHKAPGEEDAYTGLVMYNVEAQLLNSFSVYRMDWLEDAGITPGGTPEEVFDRVYFTDQAFTQSQFVEIITAFTRREGESPVSGIFIPQEALALGELTAPLAGMWGLNMRSSLTNDILINFASAGYREFLRFLNYLYKAGLCEVISIIDQEKVMDALLHAPLQGRLGWWSDQLLALGYYRVGDSRSAVLGLDPEAKLLITPPEIGSYGDKPQGAGISSILPVFQNDMYHFVINNDVSDEKLAKILEIFDELSFGKESWVTAMYGFEGEDFEWEGVPYASRVVQSQEQYIKAFMEKGTMSLHTNLYDGIAGTSLYSIGDNALMRFVQSPAAWEMIIPPKYQDLSGEFEDEQNELQMKYYTGLTNAAQEFYINAVTGEINIDAEWDAYLATLNANGLQEFIELSNKLKR